MAKQPEHLKGHRPPKRLTNLEKAKRYAEKEETGRLLAKYKFKRSKKGLETSLRRHFGKLIDRLDFIELTAILGFTIVVKELIEKTEDIASHLKSLTKIGKTPIYRLPSFSVLMTIVPPEIAKGFETEKVEFAPEWFEWLISFSIAYIIVKHAGSLIGLLDKGLTSVVKLLLGMTA